MKRQGQAGPEALTTSLSSSWMKKASPLSPSFMCKSTGSPLISMSTCNVAWWDGGPHRQILLPCFSPLDSQLVLETQAPCCPSTAFSGTLSPQTSGSPPAPHSEGLCSPSQYSCLCLGFCVPLSPTAHKNKNTIQSCHCVSPTRRRVPKHLWVT